MNGNVAIDYRNPNVVRKMGIDALTKELESVGMAYFIQQYDSGEGDYTEEREKILGEVTMESLIGDLESIRNIADADSKSRDT